MWADILKNINTFQNIWYIKDMSTETRMPAIKMCDLAVLGIVMSPTDKHTWQLLLLHGLQRTEVYITTFSIYY